eukprot:g9714.t1
MYNHRPNSGSTTSFSGSRNGARGGFRRGHRGDDDFVRAMGRMSFRHTAELKIPPLSSFTFGGEPVAGESVEIGDSIGRAEDIPLNFNQPSAYLTAMQAHTQKEFEASARQGLTNADRRGGGWLPLTCRPNPRSPGNGLSFYVDGTPSNKEAAGDGDDREGHNFKQDPWSRHLVHFEGESVPALVVVSCDGDTDHQAFLAVAFGADGGVPARSEFLKTRVRSLGYVGSFIREYGSAAKLLKNDDDNPLLRNVAAPGAHGYGFPGSEGGTFVHSSDVGALDTSSVPLNATQREAVLNLSGGLDLIVGPPGTGKSTTIYHVIKSRVQKGARVLITSIRNQAIDAVTGKVVALGVLVFGSEARLGVHAKELTMAGRMRNDPELVFWRQTRTAWTTTLQAAEAVSWKELHLLPTFHGITRLLDLEKESWGIERSSRSQKDSQLQRKKGRAAGRWAFALESVLKTNYYKRLERGNTSQKLMFRQLRALDSFTELLRDGLARVIKMLARLEALTRFRIYTKTPVLICTVDSTVRMLNSMEVGTIEAARAVGGIEDGVSSYPLTLDTAIMDEAACVLETAVPVILALGISNLVLVGDHHQLQPFSQVRENDGGKHHARSLMERCISGGRKHEFLDMQYRMHPSLSQIVSTTFYDNKLKTAEELKCTRRSQEPCKWVHVSGGETKHQGRGYSNRHEIPKVVQQVRAARKQYGRDADIRVITFYNMQKRDLEREFKSHADLLHIRIASVNGILGVLYSNRI